LRNPCPSAQKVVRAQVCEVRERVWSFRRQRLEKVRECSWWQWCHQSSGRAPSLTKRLW
jgi:hypothetical protein